MARSAAARDLGAALLVVGGALAAVYVWSGVWPPLVVIESSSMMHPVNQTSYGKIGTIDPGDMVFVKALDRYANDGRGDVEIMGHSTSEKRFGKTGDVIVFYKDGIRTIAGGEPATPIIHRAVAYVWVDANPDRNLTQYRVLWPNYFGDTPRTFNASGITIPLAGLTNYKPAHEGYITKGDNPFTNREVDQPGLARQPTKVDWITGKARGELPWFGLVKLAISLDIKNPPSPAVDPSTLYWLRIGNVYAPSDLWVMLACALVAIVTVPLGWDIWRTARERRREIAAFEPVRGRLVVKPLPRVDELPSPEVVPGRSAGPSPAAVTRFEVVGRGGSGPQG